MIAGTCSPPQGPGSTRTPHRQRDCHAPSRPLPTSAEFDPATGKHRVLYDDGDEEWVELSQERHLWVDRGKEAAARAKAAGGGARVAGRRNVRGSDRETGRTRRTCQGRVQFWLSRLACRPRRRVVWTHEGVAPRLRTCPRHACPTRCGAPLRPPQGASARRPWWRAGARARPQAASMPPAKRRVRARTSLWQPARKKTRRARTARTPAQPRSRGAAAASRSASPRPAPAPASKARRQPPQWQC